MRRAVGRTRLAVGRTMEKPSGLGLVPWVNPMVQLRGMSHEIVDNLHGTSRGNYIPMGCSQARG